MKLFKIKNLIIKIFIIWIIITLEFFLLETIIMNKSSVIHKKINYDYSQNLEKNISINFTNSKFLNFSKQLLINKIFKKTRKNLTNINSIYIIGRAKFGNMLISVNNAIIVCEFIGCKRIIIQNNKRIFINNKILYPKYNISIEPNRLIKDDQNIFLDRWFLYSLNIKDLGDVNRFNIFKQEILNNLPKLIVDQDSLSIYIRSGDIFSSLHRTIYSYAQPPLCFYENILNKFKFKQVKIISVNNWNPVIPILLNKYTNIKFEKHNIKYDIAYLINSFNIVSAKSSFITSVIKLNDNLKFLWEYDFYKLSERYYHLHPSVYSFSYNYTIYRMDASLKYKSVMYPWIHSKKQKKKMIEEKCNNNFTIIKPRI